MKARTLIVAVGATIALVGVTVQPAGAKVAKCTVSAKKVLVVGNGTRAPYYALNPRGLLSTGEKACAKGAASKGAAKPGKRGQKPVEQKPPVITPRKLAPPYVPVQPSPANACELVPDAVEAGVDYIGTGSHCADAGQGSTVGQSATAGAAGASSVEASTAETAKAAPAESTAPPILGGDTYPPES